MIDNLHRQTFNKKHFILWIATDKIAYIFKYDNSNATELQQLFREVIKQILDNA